MPKEKRETRSYNYDTPRVRAGRQSNFSTNFRSPNVTEDFAELGKNSQRHAHVEMSSSASSVVFHFLSLDLFRGTRLKIPKA